MIDTIVQIKNTIIATIVFGGIGIIAIEMLAIYSYHRYKGTW